MLCTERDVRGLTGFAELALAARHMPRWRRGTSPSRRLAFVELLNVIVAATHADAAHVDVCKFEISRDSVALCSHL